MLMHVNAVWVQSIALASPIVVVRVLFHMSTSIATIDSIAPLLRPADRTLVQRGWSDLRRVHVMADDTRALSSTQTKSFLSWDILSQLTPSFHISRVNRKRKRKHCITEQFEIELAPNSVLDAVT